MDSNYRAYSFEASFERINDILNQPQDSYEEVQTLPDRDRLTYSNGFYAYCSALFVDIRGSSSLPDTYRRPVLARIYRAYISEMVAIFNGLPAAREVNIVGDGVWAVYNTPSRTDIDAVFSLAAQANSMVKVLNYKLSKRGYTQLIKVGLGMAYGRALMIKAGYSGSGISDVVYMGDVVNRAAKLAAKGGKDFKPPLMVDEVFFSNLNAENQSLLNYDYNLGCYTCDVVNTAMETWYKANCI